MTSTEKALAGRADGGLDLLVADLSLQGASDGRTVAEATGRPALDVR